MPCYASQNLFAQDALGQCVGRGARIVRRDQVAFPLARRWGKDLDHLGRRADQAKAGLVGVRILAQVFRRPGRVFLAIGAPLNMFFVSLGLSPEQAYALAPTFAGTISFLAAILSNFMWNRYWTYPDSRDKSPRRQFAMFFVVSLVGIIIRLPIITFLHGPLTQLFALVPSLEPFAVLLGDNAALAVAVVVVMFWNFFANRYWTYNDVV